MYDGGVFRGLVAGFCAVCAFTSAFAAMSCIREANLASDNESAVRWWLLAAGSAGTAIAFAAGMLAALMGASMRL